ncbi:MAG TPA: DUF2332 domain-containing protein [Streptosporangiaceae bacterium]|nr:DUF2332 domain-containing protein [Streptosporangiaceae bacterium]
MTNGWSPPDAPASWRLTAALFQLIADHDELLDRLTELPPGRLPALLASAAISFLVRRDHPQGLAVYWPEPGKPQPAFDDGFEPAARDFVSRRLDQIAELCARHRYQMNEVARCTQIALGVTAMSAAQAEPIAFIDLGTGSGLGLQLDRYGYQVGAQPPGTDATLTLDCQLRGERQPPVVRLPPIAERAGIELNPVDLTDARARAWLVACTPPEASALTRLTAAVAVARQHPARIVAGDVVAELPAVLDALPPERHVVVSDAYLAVFLPRRDRAELISILTRAARSRRVTWLSLDPLIPLGPTGRDSVQDIALPQSLICEYQERGVFALLSVRAFAADAVSQARILARAHPSGQWIEWMDTPTDIR